MVRREVDEYGDVKYRNEQGQLHQDDDLPAMIFKDGGVIYCKNGQWHRDGDLPAIISPGGYTSYYKNDQLHRIGGPARSHAGGVIEYWIYGRQYTEAEFDKHPLVREYRLKKVMEDLLK